jgi:hypothetical protein
VTELKTEGNKLILLVVIVRGSDDIHGKTYYPKQSVCIHKLIEPYQIDS